MENLDFNPAIKFNEVGLNIVDIKNLLPDCKAKIREIKNNNKLVELHFSITAKTPDEVRQWVRHYEQKSKANYSIRSTDNSVTGQRISFKQTLICHHNTKTKNVYDPTTRNRTRNTNCPSFIYIKIRTIHDRYKGTDKSKAPDPDMPCEIKLIPHHNHAVLSADALRFRRVNEETKAKLIKLFKTGHTPATALESLKIDIHMEYDNFHEILADRSLCPDYMFCYHLYMGIFLKKYGPLELSQDVLSKKVDEFNQENNIKSALIKFVDTNYVICLCPPLLQRIHETIEEASDIVFMDSTGTVDHDGNRIFILLTSSDCGGLPLAIFITSSESAALISVGFQLLKEIMGNRIFYGAVAGPTLFMTDDSAAEQAAIRSEWPNTTNLLCIFHVLQSIWRWLINSKHGIRQEHHYEIFKRFRSILYANNEKDCKTAFHDALSKSEEYPQYQNYLQKYWNRRTLWALCYRNYVRRGHNTNNISEAAMRLLKEKIFDRIKAYNLTQVVDFLMTKFVYYYERRLLDAAHNRTRRNVLHRLIDMPPEHLIKSIQHLTDNLHLVPSEKVADLFYIVNTEVLICTCPQGRTGYICKHISWICCFVDSEKFFKKIDSEAIRKKYFFIATGNTKIASDWFKPLYSAPFQPQTDKNQNCLENIQSTLPTTDLFDSLARNDDSIVDTVDSPGDVNSQNDNIDDIGLTDNALSEGIKNIAIISEHCLKFLKASPHEASEALKVFKDKFEEIKTVSGFSSACHSFRSGTGRKNRGCTIPVQPTSVARRKTNLSGKKNNVGGRPRNNNVNVASARTVARKKTFPSTVPSLQKDND